MRLISKLTNNIRTNRKLLQETITKTRKPPNRVIFLEKEHET